MRQTALQRCDQGTGTVLPFPRRQPRYNWLSLWHLLSLDAPTVATLWVAFVARTADIRLPWSALLCMFLAVWMLYAGDRLIDGRDAETAGSRSGLEERHMFHFRHRSGFIGTLCAVGVVLALLAPSLNAQSLHLYAALSAMLALYFLLIHLTPFSGQRLPKEFAVGVFFAAAVFIPTVARKPELRPALLPSALIFAATCTLNCLYLYLWEHPTDRSAAHATTRFATSRLVWITLVLFVVEVATGTGFRQSRVVAWACAASVFALFLLHRSRKKLTPLALRAAADLALLTPLALLPFQR